MVNPEKIKLLSVQLGHDATATVTINGDVVSNVHAERVSGYRHQYGIDKETIELALNDASISENDIDYVIVTFTQQMPALVWESNYFNFTELSPTNYNINDIKATPSLVTDNPYHLDSSICIVNMIDPDTENRAMADVVLKGRASSIAPHVEQNNNWKVYECLSPRFGVENWRDKGGINTQLRLLKKALDQLKLNEQEHSRFFQKLEVNLKGRKIPGFLVDHHIAHQYSNFYSSGTDKAVIISHDGGTGMESGFVSLGLNGRVFPLTPHYIEVGQFYDYIAYQLGLGALGGAGKLMGLSAYGKGKLPANTLPKFGNIYDWYDYYRGDGMDSYEGSLYQFMYDKLVGAAKHMGMDVSELGDPEKVLCEASVEIAFSVQKLVEDVFVDLAKKLSEIFHDSSEYTLCFTGGVALNCPTNAKLYNTNLFKDVYVEPHCEDGGLTIGSSYCIHEQVFGGKPQLIKDTSSTALTGLNARGLDTVSQLCNQYPEKLDVIAIDNWAHYAAKDIHNDNIIAICMGRSETGPRALGARSIVANPKVAKNWERVNIIKQREHWRPFAPVCLKQDLNKYFLPNRSTSPFMLFTYKMKEIWHCQYPAVLHVDGTSRVQTVEEGEIFYKLLKELNSFNIGMVMNTSFNGPGSPIIQDVSQAIEMLIQTDIDTLYLEGYMIKKH